MSVDTLNADLATLRSVIHGDHLHGSATRYFADAALARVEAELSRLREAAEFAGMPAWERLWREKGAAEARCARLQQALTAVQAIQPETLNRLRANRIVFDAAPGPELSDWQNVAFCIYTDLCEAESIAREALAGPDTPAERVTHGRHCPCSACAREDWTRITGPCGMHGADCPAVYAPLDAPADSQPEETA